MVAHPRSPASLNPESTDKRLLGLMVTSLCFRNAPRLMPAVWTDAHETRDADQTGVTPLVSHGVGGGRSLKLPITIDAADLSPDFASNNMVFVGLRFVVKGGQGRGNCPFTPAVSGFGTQLSRRGGWKRVFVYLRTETAHPGKQCWRWPVGSLILRTSRSLSMPRSLPSLPRRYCPCELGPYWTSRSR